MEKKRIIQTVRQFMSLSENARTEIFARSHSQIPYIKARVMLFKSLPIEERIRLMCVVETIEMEMFIVEEILRKMNGRKYIATILVRLPASRTNDFICQTTGSLMFGEDFFKLLPLSYISKIIDDACNKRRKGQEVFEIIRYLRALSKDKIVSILADITPQSFKVMVNYNLMDIGQSNFLSEAACIADVNKIAELCSSVDTRKSAIILSKIEDTDLCKKVISLLSPDHKNSFFKKVSKNIDILKSSDVDVTKLGMADKKKFQKKFPLSSQLSTLPLDEKIEIFFSQ